MSAVSTFLFSLFCTKNNIVNVLSLGSYVRNIRNKIDNDDYCSMRGTHRDWIGLLWGRSIGP